MRSILPRSRWAAATVALIVATIALCAGFALNGSLTRYVESDGFRQMVEKETAKGLHFPGGKYRPIRRTGLVTAESEGFEATNGKKAMRSIEAHNVAARFNPLGVLLRRWQLDLVRIRSGEVEIQIYEPRVEPAPAKPWFAIFLPNRVYLKRIETETANVTWRFRGERAGIFGTRLLITPRGRDFEYRATNGTLRSKFFPDLDLRKVHLAITKKLLTLYEVDLAPPHGNSGSIHGEGESGIGDDRHIDLKVNFERVPIGEWLPSSWNGHFAGDAFGKVHWSGKNPKLESSAGEGSLNVGDGRIDDLPFLVKLAAITGEKSFEHLRLTDCAIEISWAYPKIDARKIALEESGKFRIDGAITIDGGRLNGTIELGLARKYLDWLPNADEVFANERAGYLWTTVHLSGTVESPKEDLSPRIIDILKESPFAFLALLFRDLGAWLENALK